MGPIVLTMDGEHLHVEFDIPAWPRSTSVRSGAGRPIRTTAMPHARAAQAPATG
jgi:hypothetical protein